MSMPEVSVIIPVFAAEKTLPRCLESLKNQTLQSCEFLLIDDGSKDGSGKICDAIAAEDSRFVVVHKSNGGVASARQAGLERATGNFAIHVDPDDWVEHDMLEKLVGEAKRTNADMVICDYFEESSTGQKLIVQRPSSTSSEQVLHDLFGQLHGSCCNKLISSAYYKRASFIPGLDLSEDLLYISKILLEGPRIAYLPDAFYHYVISDSNSMSSSYSAKKFRALYAVVKRLDDLFSTRPLLQRQMKERMLVYLAFVGISAPDLSNKELCEAMRGYKLHVLKSMQSVKRKLLAGLSFCGLKSLGNKIIYARERNRHN